MRWRDNGRIDMQLATAIFGLSCFGLLMLYTASAELSRTRTGDSSNSTYYLGLQLISFGIGLVFWVILQQIDYRKYLKYRTIWLILTLVLLLSIMVFSKGEVKGAHRWISIFGQTFQPSEFAKITFILYLAAWFSEKKQEIRHWTRGFVPFMVIICVISALMLQQRDLGSLGVYVSIAGAMYIVAGARLRQIGAILATLLGIAFLAIKAAPYRMQRLLAFVNADANPQGSGYHITQAKIAIGLGGMWGKGFLQGTQKRGFLPEGHTDSIFAIIVEELGFLRASGLVVAYGFIAHRGLRIARFAPDQFGSLVAVGITTWFISQSLINISAMVSLIPLTGVPLPFISYGRTSLVALFMGTGILLNISRYIKKD